MRLTVEQRKLVESNMRLVSTYLSEHAPRWLVRLYPSWMDAQQTCAVGLMAAVAKHDTSKGELSTYAFSCMYHAMLTYASYQQVIRRKDKNRGFAVPVDTGIDLRAVEQGGNGAETERLYNWLCTAGVAYFDGRPLKQGLLRRVLLDGAPEASDKLKTELFRELGVYADIEGVVYKI